MKFLLVQSMLFDAEDEEAAATIAIEAEKAAKLNELAVLDRHGVTAEEAQGIYALLGVQLARIPEGFVA